ncbi:HAMP domain-containing histidine kinase [Hazenella sp. IB182357]|uniref:histidine kinase n=1 Tax=Polycladospora coralii TaxID=2771432 RepID=A0A926NF04_9BACL|nr:HAMP domain-containing sensor histidine kinase [Polycladospora coralii]MBD1372324.1 HAMP domain-containing histidine kinase [Polycladospora coralii]MBS7531486.1 HAMP domain-containing histidine kinase [Polycladospora coralii]
MKFNIKVAAIIAIFSSGMLVFITAILLYKGHEHLMMLRISNSKEVIHHFDMALRETALWSLGLLLIVTVISSVLIASAITRPIQELNGLALKLVRGDRNLSIGYTINDQIGQLGRSLKQLDETLNVYEWRRKEMTQDLAHEIRNPLASIKSYLSAFEDGVWTATPDRLQACIEELDRLIMLVGELDTLNDINSPIFQVNMSVQPIADLIEKSVVSLASELLAKEIQVKLDLDKTIHAKVDALRLNQILHNIIKNSMYHIQEEGSLFIKLYIEKNDYIILVRDNGVGMDEETSEKIFERNYRGGNRYTGNGIGMTITQKLVEAHEGTISVKSEKNIGTTFCIHMPIST